MTDIAGAVHSLITDANFVAAAAVAFAAGVVSFGLVAVGAAMATRAWQPFVTVLRPLVGGFTPPI